MTGVLATEMGRALVAHVAGSRFRIDALLKHHSPCFQQTYLLLILQG